MKSITPIKKPKVLQTFGKRKFFNTPTKLEKSINTRKIDKKVNFIALSNFSKS